MNAIGTTLPPCPQCGSRRLKILGMAPHLFGPLHEEANCDIQMACLNCPSRWIEQLVNTDVERIAALMAQEV